MKSRPNDGMVLVMGKSGAGKSYFINQLKPGSVTVGHTLNSETERCQAVLLELSGGKTITVVDTPGFYDNKRDDAEILTEIAEFLAAQYASGIPLRGILYLYHIMDTRAPQDYPNHIDMFKSLIGEAALENLTLELLDNYWDSMVAGGACVSQFDGSAETARALVIQHMGKKDVVLEMNKEMMGVEGKDVLGTAAGQLVQQQLRHRQAEEEKTLDQLQAQARMQDSHGDLAAAKSTREKQAAAQLTLRRLADSDAKMRDNRPGPRVQQRINEFGERLRSGSGEWTRTAIQVLAAVLQITVQIVSVAAGAG